MTMTKSERAKWHCDGYTLGLPTDLRVGDEHLIESQSETRALTVLRVLHTPAPPKPVTLVTLICVDEDGVPEPRHYGPGAAVWYRRNVHKDGSNAG